MIVSELLLFPELALAACGLEVDEAALKTCARLLAILRRNLKMTTTVIVRGNANQMLFEQVRSKPMKPLIYSQDITTEDRINYDKLDLLRHSVRALVGVNLFLEPGRRSTLLITSMRTRALSPSDLELVTEVCNTIEEQYAHRRHTGVRDTLNNLRICSALLSGVNGYFHPTFATLHRLRSTFIQLRHGNVSKLVHSELAALALRLEAHTKDIESAIERALTIAAHYTLPTSDLKERLVHAFAPQTQGFTESMNALLLRLSAIRPDHQLLWCYKLDPSLAGSGHRTFLAHLVFFLEGLVFRWADRCAASQISLSFEPSSLTSEPVKSIVSEASKKATRGAGETMMQSSSVEALHRGGGGMNRMYQPSLSAREGSGLQHGYLVVLFQPMVDGGEWDQRCVLDCRLKLDNLRPEEMTHSSRSTRSWRERWFAPSSSGSGGVSTKTLSSDKERGALKKGSADVPRMARSHSYDSLATAKECFDGSMPRASTVELLRVLQDFLRELDPNAGAGILPPTEDGTESIQTYQLRLPCLFQTNDMHPRRSFNFRVKLRNKELGWRGDDDDDEDTDAAAPAMRPHDSNVGDRLQKSEKESTESEKDRERKKKRRRREENQGLACTKAETSWVPTGSQRSDRSLRSGRSPSSSLTLSITAPSSSLPSLASSPMAGVASTDGLLAPRSEKAPSQFVRTFTVLSKEVQKLWNRLHGRVRPDLPWHEDQVAGSH